MRSHHASGSGRAGYTVMLRISVLSNWENICGFHGRGHCTTSIKMMQDDDNNEPLTKGVAVYTITPCMGRPPKAKHLVRSKMLPIRLTSGEFDELEAAARRLGVTVAEMMRDGARLYIQLKGKDGS